MSKFSLFLFSSILSLLLLLIPLTQSRIATSLPPTINLASSTFTVTDFGATGNGRDYDTGAIQSSIDACPSPRPCHVLFPPGTYLTETIHLRSGVVLVVEEASVILAGTRLEDYPLEAGRWYAVLAEQVDDVGITGGGEINGQGLKFLKRFDERKM